MVSPIPLVCLLPARDFKEPLTGVREENLGLDSPGLVRLVVSVGITLLEDGLLLTRTVGVVGEVVEPPPPR